MERLTSWCEEIEEAFLSCEKCKKNGMTECWSQENCTQTAVDRLAEIEDILGNEYNLDRLSELVKADREGRIAILSEPMKPLVYKPNDTDVYCPNCGETLSGGWPLSDADDCRKIYQCFYCGQSIDTEKCVPYESDLKERKNDG